MSEQSNALLAALDSGGESASFCVSGTLRTVLPGLSVTGVGTIALPLTTAVARRLVSVAERAPYGRGAATVLDTDVRRVWQLEPERFELTNPEWSALVAEAVETVKSGLGIRAKVQPQLYKLLLYDKGSFFTPHRDSEKADGMFATLVVGLPSAHEGGELLVTHDGETHTVEFGGPRSAHDVQYASFYTDCVHEIRPVTRGYRLALVYNLMLEGRRRLKAPATAAATAATVAALEGLFSDGERLRLAVPLAHNYTQKGLTPALLKGADRGRVAALFAATRRLGYRARLGLLEVHQSGEANMDGWYDDDELQNAGMGEVFEERVAVEHVVDEHGEPCRPRRLDLDLDELIFDGELDDLPWEKEVTEASGNEGVSFDRWYRSGVAVVWPPAREHELLCRQGQSAALPALARLVSSARTDADRSVCRTFAARITKTWQRHDPNGAAQMLELLAVLGDVSLATGFLESVVIVSPRGDEGPALVKLARVLGFDLVADGVSAALANLKPLAWNAKLAPVAVLIEALCVAASGDADGQLATRELAALLAERILTWDEGRRPRDPDREDPDDFLDDDDDIQGVIDFGASADDEEYGGAEDESVIFLGVGDDEHDEDGEFKGAATPAADKSVARRTRKSSSKAPHLSDRARTIEALVRALDAAGEHELLDATLTFILSDEINWPLVSALAPAALALRDATGHAASAARDLRDHCTAALAARVADEPAPPADWRLTRQLRCQCRDCQTVNTFLRDPQLKVLRLPLSKERRKHLHRAIDGTHLPLEHVTNRGTSPNTLVCTKTRADHERRVREHARDVALLARLGGAKARRGRRHGDSPGSLA